jgi:cobalt/nickel transport system permease protein
MTPPIFDARLRILITLAAIAVVLMVRHHAVLAVLAALLVMTALLLPDLGPRLLVRRLLAVNLFAAMLLLLVPWSVPGEPILIWASLGYSREGLLDTLRIALKANAVVLVVTVLLTPVDPIRLGQAVSQLGAPNRLVQLYLFTLRYLRVLEHEYRQLRRAMRIRGFQARANLHTLRAFGYLLGMLLIRALDRAERIWHAMLCRGFTGRFPTTRTTPLAMIDFAAAGLAVAVMAAALGADYALRAL